MDENNKVDYQSYDKGVYDSKDQSVIDQRKSKGEFS